MYKRLREESTRIEQFNYSNVAKKLQRNIKMQMEVKKVMHQYVAGYNQENFELRDRLMDATASC